MVGRDLILVGSSPGFVLNRGRTWQTESNVGQGRLCRAALWSAGFGEAGQEEGCSLALPRGGRHRRCDMWFVQACNLTGFLSQASELFFLPWNSLPTE
jgi:hypothetical protein